MNIFFMCCSESLSTPILPHDNDVRFFLLMRDVNHARLSTKQKGKRNHLCEAINYMDFFNQDLEIERMNHHYGL
jgi:hypothetical protein